MALTVDKICESCRSVKKSATDSVRRFAGAFSLDGWHSLSLVRKGLVCLGLFVIIVYPASAFITHTIDDDLDYMPPSVGSSPVVSAISGLIDRETREHTWVANKPALFPQALLLDNMPNFQMGIVAGLHAGALGIVRVSASEDVAKAAQQLGAPGNIWGFGRNNSVKTYRAAAAALKEHAADMGMNAAFFNSVVLELTEGLDRHISASNAFISDGTLFKSDDYFYRNKGYLYAAYIILRDSNAALHQTYARDDFEVVMRPVLSAMRETVEYSPAIILSLSAKPSLLPNHLMVQTYHMMRIRDALRKIYFQEDGTI